MQRLRNTRKENAITKQRLYVVLLINLIFYGLLLSRTYHLQISQHKTYQQLATQNQLRKITIYPPRANIVDRHGKTLAHNQAEFNACYIPDEIQSTHLTYIRKNTVETITYDKYECSHLHSWDFAHVSAWTDIQQNITEKRVYPYGNIISHILGYTHKRRLNPLEDLSRHKQHEGAVGLEKFYEPILKGHNGLQANYVTAKGDLISQSYIQDTKRSSALETTLDIHLQQKAHHELFSHTGTVIMLNPNNGEILAAVSSPSFDPNNPHQTDNDTALFNRITQAKYPPGSILKPFIALMALEDKYIKPEEKIEDQGYIDVGNKRFHDWLRTGHGEVNLKRAIEVSCDVYFYLLAQKIGINRMVDYLMLFDFDKKTNIDLPHEKNSLIPKYHYRNNRSGGWYEGHTIMTAIGQGDIELTPISLARATMMLANKGFNHQLHFTKDHEHIMSTPQIEASDQNWRRIHDAMEAVTKTGTARAFAQSSYPIAGKTGSAQVKSIKTKAEYKTLPKHQKDHHLFIGFSPIENPQVALVVITEHEHQAVKTAKHMLDFYWQNHTNHDAN